MNIAIKMNSRSEEFKQNKQAMQELVDDLNQLAAKIQLGGGEKARENIWPGVNCYHVSVLNAF